jgi:hypothetical protein
MAGMRRFASMAHSDDELFDMAKARAGISNDDVPEYPPGMRFTIHEADFEALGIGDVQPGANVRFAAFARATSVNRRTDGCRIEAQIEMLSLDEGEFVDLEEEMRPSICLNEHDHERLDLDEEAQRGDMLHLIGTARVESTDDNRYMGRSVSLQIIEADVEDEDQEGEDG